MHEISTEDGVSNLPGSKEIAVPATAAKIEGSGVTKFALNKTDNTRIVNDNAGSDTSPGNK
jgi:hypothetical protein